MKTIYLLINPICPRSHLVTEEVLEKNFPESDFQLEIHVSKYNKHEKILAQEAVDKNFDILVVAGGSGTIHNCLEALAYSNTHLGIIPTGAGNPFSYYSNTPLNIDDALKLITKDSIRKIDLGRVYNQEIGTVLFKNYMGIGATARLANRLKGKKKKYINYVIEGLKIALKYSKTSSSFNLKFNFFEQKLQPFECFIGNIGTVGRNSAIVKSSSIIDNCLDIAIGVNISFFRLVNFLFGSLFFVKDHLSDISDYHKAEAITLDFHTKTCVQLDLEPYEVIGQVDVDVMHLALSVIIPEETKYI